MPAVAAVAGIDVVVVALMALILAYASWLLLRPIILGMLAELPVVGGWAADRVDWLVGRAVSVVQGWISSALQAAIDLITRVRTAATYSLWWCVQTLEEVVNVAWQLRYVVIPGAIAQAIGYANQLYTAAVQYALALYYADLQYTIALVTQDEEYARSLFASGLAFTESEFAGAIAFTRSAFASLLAYAGAQFAAEIAFTQREVASAEQFAHSLYVAETAWAAGEIASAERYAGQLAAADREYALALQRLALGYADAVGASVLAAAGALVIPLAADVQAIRTSKCFRACDVLGDLGAGLQDLDMALILALMVAGATDPRGGLAVVEETIGGPARSALDAVRQLVKAAA